MAFVQVDSPREACRCGMGFTTQQPATAPDWLKWVLIGLAALIVARLIFGATPAGRRRARLKATEKARTRHRREMAEIRSRYA